MDVEVVEGQTVAVPIVLSEAPNGVIAYNLTFKLDNAAIGEIAGVAFPPFGLIQSYVDNAYTVRMQAVDLRNLVGPGATDVALATVYITGVSSGSATLQIEWLDVSDNLGVRFAPDISTGDLVVSGNGG